LTGPLAPWFAECARRAASRFGDLVDAARVEAAVRAVERGEADKALVWALFPLVSAEACARSLFGGAA
ncbi:MAG TPA: hypothetical protein VMV18_08250, partial [bacterium]|nr:hypothetical protein [bacterium]